MKRCDVARRIVKNLSSVSQFDPRLWKGARNLNCAKILRQISREQLPFQGLLDKKIRKRSTAAPSPAACSGGTS
jgi:hypothetical protein